MAAFSFLFLNFFFNLRLCSYGCMIRSRNPERTLSLHASISDHDVLNGEHKRAAHVKISGDVWRWEDDGKRFGESRLARRVSLARSSLRQIIRIKIPTLLPQLRNARLCLS